MKEKPDKIKKIKSITAIVLESLFNVAEDFLDLSLTKKAAYRHLSTYGMINREYEWTESKVGKWIASLKQGDYIKIVERSGKKSVELTNKGKIKIIESIAKSRLSDNIHRFVSFDIPEPLRNQRNLFRKAIKEMGFKQVQQSLWVINKDVGDLVQIAEYEYGVEKYVAYIMSSESDIDGIVNKILV